MKLILILCFVVVSGLINLGVESGNVILQNEFAKIIYSDEKFIKIKTFKFYKKTRTLAALNVTYETLVDIISDEQTKVSLAALQFKDNEYKKTVIDFSIGICNLYRANKFDTTSLIRYSNIEGCPFKKGLYYMNDVAPTAEILPPFFPEGKWLVDMSFSYYANKIARVQWMFLVKKTV